MAEIANLKALLSLDSTKFQQGARSAGKSSSGLRNAISQTGTAIAGMAAGLAAAFKQTADFADAIGKTATRSGISTTALQELRHAFELAGVDAGVTDASVVKFGKNIGELRQGTGTLTTFLEKYDKQLAENLKTAKDNTEALDIFLNAMGNAESQADKLALASAGLGRSGTLMTAAFKDGTNGFIQAREEAKNLGIVLSESGIKNAEDFNDTLTRVSGVIKSQFGNALLDLAPLILNNKDNIILASKAIGETLVGAINVAVPIFKAIGEVFFSVGTLIADFAIETDKMIIAVEKMVAKIGVEFKKLVKFFSPVTDAITATTGAFKNMFNKVVGNSFVPDMVEGIRIEFGRLPNIMGKQTKDVVGDVKSTFESGMTDIITGASSWADAMQSIIGSVQDKLISKSVSSATDALLDIGGSIFSGFDFSSLLGFAHGGSFEVGGSGGIDSSLVAFKATPGENVTIGNGLGQSGGGDNVTVNLNVQTGVAQTVRAEMMSMIPALKQVIGEAIADKRSRDPKFSARMGV